MASFASSATGASVRRSPINATSSWASIVSGTAGAQQQPLSISSTSGAVRIHRNGIPSNSNDGATVSTQSIGRYQLPTIATTFPASANGQALNQPPVPSSIPTYLEESCYAERLSSARNTYGGATSSSQGGVAGASGKAQLPSYRGVALEVKENISNIRDLTLPPLPSRWSEEDKSSGIEISNEGFDVKFAPTKWNENDAAAVRANNYMPPQCGVFYFEVTIVSKGREGLIGIGFCTKNFPLTRLPGWEPESWGYHGDDGRAFCCQGIGKTYGPQFNSKDVIGCGVNFRNHTAFFTRNGIELGTAFKDTNKGKLYPAIGMKRMGEHVRVNFGQQPFVFDIDGYIRHEKNRAYDDINMTSVAKLCPPLDETALIQSLIATYLQHDGYVDTARAFASELQAEAKALAKGQTKGYQSLDLREDVDAMNRQSIRGAILMGDIDHALKLTDEYYPSVLSSNEKIHFKLRCRKLIEMVRLSSESNFVSNGHAHDEEGEEEDIDMDDENLNFGDSNKQDWEMETDDEDQENEIMDDGPLDQNDAMKDLLHAALEFGRELEEDYKDKPEMRASLDEAFSLFAYTDPHNSVVGHLLEDEGRLSVAEELNSAILVSLGKSSIAPLERLIQQTTVLVREVSEDGGPATLVNVQDWVASPDIVSL